MTNKFCKFLGFVALAVNFSSCTSQNVDSQNRGLLQGIIGGKTDAQTNGSVEKKQFNAISKHVAMIALEEISPSGRKVVEKASAVILNDNFVVTSAHIFEGFKFDSSHQGVIFFGASGDWQKRQRQEFSKNDILNRNADELTRKGWSLDQGNKDYVFIRIKNGLPSGFSKIAMMNDYEFFKNNKNYRFAGFGRSENGVDDSLMRTLDLTLSRYNSNQASDKFSPIPNILGVEDRNYFLEFYGDARASISLGDSGGAVYFEGTDEQGAPMAFLAGIITGYQSYGQLVADYCLRVDAFYNDAIATSRRIIKGDL